MKRSNLIMLLFALVLTVSVVLSSCDNTAVTTDGETESTVSTSEVTDTEAPATTDEVTDTDAPTTTEALIDTDAPMTTEAPATTAAPVTTEAPAVSLPEISVTSTSGNYSITLDWEDYRGAEKYEVYFRLSGVGDYKLLATTESSEYAFTDAGWGASYDFVVKAKAAASVLAESALYTAKSEGTRANDGAPKDDKMVIFCKAMSDKSDGFVVYVNGEIYVIDSGVSSDRGVSNYLVGLRQEWLAALGVTDIGNVNAKLAINIIVSHYHADHADALTSLAQTRLFSVEKVYMPAESQMDINSENKRTKLISALKAVKHNYDWIEVPFGEEMNFEFAYSDAKLDLYPAIIDWSVTFPNDKTKGWLFICQHYSGSNRTTYAINCNSLWAKFTDGSGNSVLFTGDTGDKTEIINTMLKYYGVEKFDVDVLKYIHHGSVRYSAYLTQMTSPSITLFTADESHLTSQKSKDAYMFSSRYGDVYNVHDGNLTITFDHGTIIPEGIEPRKNGIT